MIAPTITGAVEQYLLEGQHAEKLALLEYFENTLISAFDVEAKGGINIEEIHETDMNRGLDALFENIKYHGK
jgi:hypothetical protein